MTLSESPTNKDLRVKKVVSDSRTTQRLSALGLAEGSIISLLFNQRGAVVALVKNSRLALDKNISSNIEVEEVSL